MSKASSQCWDEVTFNDIIEDSAFGPRFSGDLYDDDGNIATLRTTDISPDGIISYETMPLARLDETLFTKHYLKINDLVITRSGRVGTTALFDGYHLPVLPGAFLIRFRLIDKAVPKFFKYWFNSRLGQQRLLSVARGAAQQNINITNVKTVRVPLPSVTAQSTIASLLSTYDDLIENNRRRIQLLESAARLLYKEWFVHLRFPGHEHTKITDGVPEGWEKIALGNLITLHKGLSYKGKHLVEHGVPMINLKCIDRGGGFRSEGIKFYDGDFKDRHCVEPGDIVLANTDLTQAGDVIGSAAVVPRKISNKAFISHHLFAVRIGDELAKHRIFLFNLFNDNRFKGYARGHASGTTVLGLRASSIETYSFYLPPIQLRNLFEEQADKIEKLVELLDEKNDHLKRARDLLLPRLMAGEVAV